jgi:hypothetical protein
MLNAPEKPTAKCLPTMPDEHKSFLNALPIHAMGSKNMKKPIFVLFAWLRAMIIF